MDKRKKVSKSKNIKTSNSVSSKVERKNVKSVKSKNLLICMLIIFAILLLLILRLAYLQFIKGPDLKEAANRQQSTNRVISAKRGNIYDSTGKLLAASASVDTVSINPSKIKKENKENQG